MTKSRIFINFWSVRRVYISENFDKQAADENMALDFHVYYYDQITFISIFTVSIITYYWGFLSLSYETTKIFQTKNTSMMYFFFSVFFCDLSCKLMNFYWIIILIFTQMWRLMVKSETHSLNRLIKILNYHRN